MKIDINLSYGATIVGLATVFGVCMALSSCGQEVSTGSIESDSRNTVNVPFGYNKVAKVCDNGNLLYVPAGEGGSPSVVPNSPVCQRG